MNNQNWLELSTADRLRKCAADIEALEFTDTPHSQRFWVHDCGTPMCLAGHAVSNDPTFRVDGILVLESETGIYLDWPSAGIVALGLSFPEYGRTGMPSIHSGIALKVPLFAQAADVTPVTLKQLAADIDDGLLDR